MSSMSAPSAVAVLIDRNGSWKRKALSCGSGRSRDVRGRAAQPRCANGPKGFAFRPLSSNPLTAANPALHRTAGFAANR